MQEFNHFTTSVSEKTVCIYHSALRLWRDKSIYLFDRLRGFIRSNLYTVERLSDWVKENEGHGIVLPLSLNIIL